MAALKVGDRWRRGATQSEDERSEEMGDADVLKWVGVLGHTVVVLVDDAHGGRRCSLECSSVSAAKKYAAEMSGKHPAIYRKGRGGKWLSVAAA